MFQGEEEVEEINCINIATKDRYALTQDYFDVVKERLSDENEPVDIIRFVILTTHHNLKKKFNKSEQYFLYDVTLEIDIRKYKTKIKDIDELTNTVIKDMFSKYKKHIIIH